MKITKFFTILFALTICFLGCKEQIVPCGDPPNFYVSLKFIDKITLKNAVTSIDSIEFKVPNEKVDLSFSILDCQIIFDIYGNNFRQITYRIKPNLELDTLKLFYRFESYQNQDCPRTSFYLDSIYHNNKKIESNTIYY